MSIIRAIDFIHCFKNKNLFIKFNFTDIDTHTAFKEFTVNAHLPESLSKSIKVYEDLFLVASILDPNYESETKEIMERYNVIYSHIKGFKIIAKYTRRRNN